MAPERQETSTTGNRRSNVRLAGALVVFVATMVGMAYAAVPLYEIFCRITGYGGTTQTAERAPNRIVDRSFTVRLDANLAAGVPWKFAPTEQSVTVKAGEAVTTAFRLESLSERSTVATATFNVTPLTSGVFFNKIACFCFTEQQLAPGEVREVPVTFFIDPDIVDDPDLENVTTITLSYTFFAPPGGKPAESLAARQSGKTGQKL